MIVWALTVLLHMMRFIQPLCDELRKYILAYQFADETEEISF